VSATASPRKRRASKPGRRLFAFDRALGVRFVAGADEAGRGCLAGPLVAAAVLFDYERLRPVDMRALATLNDSKQQTAAGREELYPAILRIATRVAVVSRCATGIDRRGLHVTNLAALRDALARVVCQGCVCLSDGFAVADLDQDQRAVVGGDARSAAIAAASVIAKVTRDRYMQRADALHPGWEFASHVGYATPEHRAAIERLGTTPLHRMSFQSAAYQQLAL
jgi:ribonuclease HII